MTSEQTEIDGIAVHFSGNKTSEEGIRLSKSTLNLSDDVKELLKQYFLSPFKSKEYFHFFHEDNLADNAVYKYASALFDQPESLYEQSVHLVKYLYENSNHPKVKSGEFYVVYFKDADFNGEPCDAVGLFKSETKEPFLKVFPSGENYRIESEEGVNIHKLDKGCMIYNFEREEGYVVAVVDNAGKSVEAQLWIDQFLHVLQRSDDYSQTKNALSMCRNFVMEKLPEEFEVSKADQAELLTKSVQFFKDKERFNLEEFAQEVMQQPEVIEKFKAYKTDYEDSRDFEVTEDFSISDQAVKKQSKIFKSIIKLDKNFHIYVHGKAELITKGFDQPSGMHFYQLFFKEES